MSGRGDLSKDLLKVKVGVFPRDIDVSIDDKVYFAYKAKKGNAICSMDIETGQLNQITEDGNNDYSPVVSNDGKRIVFKRGSFFGHKKTLYLVNSDGTDCTKILDKDIYISNIVFSKNDSTIYFIGGALFSDSSNVIQQNTHCQDIFSVDINGDNFRRLTFNCITSLICDLKLVDEDKIILVSVLGELNIYGESTPSDDYLSIKNYYDTYHKPFHRLPYVDNFIGLINIQTGDMTNLETKVSDLQTKTLNNKYQKENPILEKSTYNNKEDFYLFGSYHFYKFDLKTKAISYLFTNESIYNYKFQNNQNKLIGGVDRHDGFKLVLFDLENNQVERYLEIDSAKFLPSHNRTIFINN